jgi:hypothetical protein
MKLKLICFLVIFILNGCANMTQDTPSINSEVMNRDTVYSQIIQLESPEYIGLIPALCEEVGLRLSFEIPQQTESLKIIGCQKDSTSENAVMMLSNGHELKLMWPDLLESEAREIIELIETI